MKILWLSNTLPEQISKALFRRFTISGGWIAGMAVGFAGQAEHRLYIAAHSPFCKAPMEYQVDGITYLVFPDQLTGAALVRYLIRVLEQFQPDLVHVFGAEHPQSLQMLRVCREKAYLDRTVLSIQGLAGMCAQHYCTGIPESELRKRTLRDLLRGGGILNGQKRFRKLGVGEREAIQLVRHVIGRTDWDHACVTRIHPEVTYHFCSETLRSSFYSGQWDYGTCRRHSIFVNYSGHPIKGFHFLLEAMPDILRVYPDAHIYAAGADPLAAKSWLARQRQTHYANFIGRRIQQLGLAEHITFLGALSEAEMKVQFLKTHVFVLSSSIENSPNTLGEAMLLGVPSVAADVGGVKNLLTHGKEGYTYPADAPDMLARCVGCVFEQGSGIKTLTEAGKRYAQERYDRCGNHRRLLEIYHAVTGEAHS